MGATHVPAAPFGATGCMWWFRRSGGGCTGEILKRLRHHPKLLSLPISSEPIIANEEPH